MVFRAEDWSRLKKVRRPGSARARGERSDPGGDQIAEGNPDESKIGAFGVGLCVFRCARRPARPCVFADPGYPFSASESSVPTCSHSVR